MALNYMKMTYIQNRSQILKIKLIGYGDKYARGIDIKGVKCKSKE